MKKRWMTVEQAARELGITRQGVHYQIQTGKLKAKKRKITVDRWMVLLEGSRAG